MNLENIKKLNIPKSPGVYQFLNKQGEIIYIGKAADLRSAIASDKLFFPGEKKPLELPLASPALHIIKRARDEAHRFAILYHRKLRRKEFLK